MAFILDTDASVTGIGAVLSQRHRNAENVIAYAAKDPSKAERNYSTTRKKLLALIWGMEHFAPYLIGKQFMARTDHNALKWIKNFTQPKGEVARWIERLSIFEIEHQPGCNHGNADGLSRTPREDTVIKENEFHIETRQACNLSREDKSTTWYQRWSNRNMKLYQ